jgi:hypothetical protein
LLIVAQRNATIYIQLRPKDENAKRQSILLESDYPAIKGVEMRIGVQIKKKRDKLAKTYFARRVKPKLTISKKGHLSRTSVLMEGSSIVAALCLDRFNGSIGNKHDILVYF